ncbi:cell wall-active antibiotics response protein [Mucilaginibacter sp. RB4R14]|uniref:LiaF transmembrane domain-containing protein n=1 Tax=Mucilaginibacter aurantiaciroseus TaxID=2949308 RepID=UPI0020919CCE|nr:LiaF domain-containing protein [Mucilaginibacter aurantiaciroseus]MCO5934313.1 cell wall-active antibiotics response protein [Mucilaginibacter aurantiaciroseus]
MSDHIDETNRTPKNKVLAGVILLAVGGVLLVKQFNFFFFPNWLLSWPLGLIVLGLYFGAKHNFRKPVWFILIIIGAFNLLDDIFPRVNWGDIGFPVILISFGLWIIMRKRNEPVIANSDYWDKKYKANPFGNTATATEKPLANFDTEGAAGPETAEQPIGSMPPPTPDDYLNATAIFGGVNKTILSKNFQGGDITNVFGGTELDFTQADIHGRVTIDITQMFGGTKIIVPANWHVVPDLAAVFAGVDDKRIKTSKPNPIEKVLVLKGVSIFAGVDIRSY